MLRAAGTLRALDEKGRRASFVASTERAVAVGPYEPEVLRAAGCDLSRFEKSPVVLDSHQRDTIDAVIGKGTMTVDKKRRQVLADVEFAETERGERAWRLVKDGFVRAVSVGYMVDEQSVRRIRAGETDGDGDAMVRGPASVVNRWQVIELSIVPVGADEDAVRRSFYAGITRRAPRPPKTSAYRQAVLAICPPSLRDFAEELMAENIPVEPTRTVPLARTIRGRLLAEHKRRHPELARTSAPAMTDAEFRASIEAALGIRAGSVSGGKLSAGGSASGVQNGPANGGKLPEDHVAQADDGDPRNPDSTAEKGAKRDDDPQKYECPACGHVWESEARGEEVVDLGGHETEDRPVELHKEKPGERDRPANSVTCPGCGHSFEPQGESADDKTKALAAARKRLDASLAEKLAEHQLRRAVGAPSPYQDLFEPNPLKNREVDI